MILVHRILECGLGHRFERLMEKGSSPPDDCPICNELLKVIPLPHERTDLRSDTVEAPALRSERTKAVARFEYNAFKRPHYDDGSPMLTNLRDNTKPGEAAAIPETASTNSVHAFMAEQAKRAKETPNAGHMAALGGGWGVANGSQLAALGGVQHNTFGRPSVDLQSNKKV